MELSSDKCVRNHGLNSTPSRSPSPITTSMSSLSLARSTSSSSTPPTILQTTKCGTSRRASFWKSCRRYWMCFSLIKSKPKIEEKSTRGHGNESSYHSRYAAMSFEERDEHMKEVISYCNNSNASRDSDKDFSRR